MAVFEFPDDPPAEECARRLEDFFSMADSGELFSMEDGRAFRKMREGLREALEQLLMWQRPRLERLRGIAWPYEGLRERYGVLESAAEGEGDSLRALQARLFLGLLPFPRQWSWMLRLEASHGEEAEVRRFLEKEQAKILRKIRKKPQDRFKLRHLCQVIKPFHSPREKGILRIFSLPYLWSRRELLARLTSRYVLYVEPSMGVVWRHAWCRYFSELEDPCVLGVGSPEDLAFVESQPHLEGVSLAHSDYLEDLAPPARESSKEFDIVFNATYDEMDRKRHALLLKLMHHPLLSEARALFLGRGEESNVRAFRERVGREGLQDRVAVLANLKRKEVPSWLARCKMAVHLSVNENGCRSIYEFFRADLPCVASSCMAGTSPAIFNPRTGAAVPDEDLPEAIARVLSRFRDYEPRSWFVEHSGSANSSRKLNAFFKERFARWGYGWSEDVVALGSSGANRYVREEDYARFLPEFRWILSCFEESGPWPVPFSVE